MLSKTDLNIVYHNNITENNLRGISTPLDDIAWICGANGTVIRTINGGTTWDSKKVPGAEQLDFRDIKAFDMNTAYVMSVGNAEHSRIYKTNDGGKNWNLQLQGQHQSEFFNCMAFWNQNHGLVLSDPVGGKFTLYETQNGDTWSAISQDGMPMALTGEGAFAASGSCMTVSGKEHVWFGTGVNTARVFCSKDGGFNWSVSETPIKKDTKSSGIFSITFSDVNNGMISGGDYSAPELGGSNLAITNNGGSTWQLVEIAPQYYWSAISLSTDKKNYMVVGSTHIGYAATNFSQEEKSFIDSEETQLTVTNESKLNKNIQCSSWEKSMSNVNLNAFSFWKKDKVLAVGPKGTIAEVEISVMSI